MPSLLSCFCVHHRRHTFASRKRNSRKKILSHNSDWISDTNSDLYNRALQEAEVHKPCSPEKAPHSETEDSEDILSRLLESQASPRRRHVQDIFRQDPPEIERLPDLESLYRGFHQTPSHSVERMNGYVPKAVGELSASTVLTGAKMDDFFSDCRLHPALNRFAKSTDFGRQSAEYYTIDRHETRPSVVKVGSTRESFYAPPPSGLHIEIEAEKSRFDDVMRGSVSSTSASPVPSEDENSSSEPLQGGFFFQDNYTPSRNNASFEPNLENMFHSDGDILY